MKRIGVFTSGGDSPGMNAAIRSVVRSADYFGMECFGIYRGYDGMIAGEIEHLTPRSVGRILGHGGTILKTARSQDFMTKEGRQRAFDQLKKKGIDGLVAIGGDGTFTGARVFTSEFDIPVIGMPGTIDNDLFGTDYTIGFDTAVNTVVEAVDKIRDTADSHDRLFFVEVMGRDSGFIALKSGIASGATAILLPEVTLTLEELVAAIGKTEERGKENNIVIVAEGNPLGNAETVSKKVCDMRGICDSRVTVLGHIQRGGAPTCADRVLAARLGFHAVKGLKEGLRNVMAGMQNDREVYVPFDLAIDNKAYPNLEELRLAGLLAL
jgi:6-phosphofructokinase 1